MTDTSYEGLISVAIPVADGEPFIRSCLSSIVDQSHHNIEIVVGDNRSTDRTREIVESFSDPRIRILPNPERRLSIYENWQRTVDAVGGDFVKIVAHDDGLKPGCLARQAALLAAEPTASMVASRRSIIDARDRVVISARGLGRLRHAEMPRAADLAEIVRACARAGTNLLGEPASVLFRRKCLPEPLLDETWNFEGDLDLYFRCLESGAAILDDGVVAFFRVSPQQMSAQVAGLQAREIQHFFDLSAVRYPGSIRKIDSVFTAVNSHRLAWSRRLLYSYQRMFYR